MGIYESISTELSYNPLTGKFLWKTVRKGRKKEPGCKHNMGYISICVDGKHYLAHRLAYLLMKGTLPEQHIDHINHDRADNTWSNLREASYTVNGKNRSLHSRNTTGTPGVTLISTGFRATIHEKGKKISLGVYSTLDEAIGARKRAERKYGYHQNNGGVNLYNNKET